VNRSSKNHVYCTHWIGIFTDFYPSAYICPFCGGLIIIDKPNLFRTIYTNMDTQDPLEPERNRVPESLGVYWISRDRNWESPTFLRILEQRLNGLKIVPAIEVDPATQTQLNQMFPRASVVPIGVHMNSPFFVELDQALQVW